MRQCNARFLYSGTLLAAERGNKLPLTSKMADTLSLPGTAMLYSCIRNLKRPIQEALRNSHNTNSKCRSEKFHTRCERACGSNILIIASPNAEKYKIIKRIRSAAANGMGRRIFLFQGK